MSENKSIYRAILDEGFADEIASIPEEVIDGLIEDAEKGEIQLTPASPDAHNIDHSEILGLIHDILVFAGIVIYVYRPGARPPSKEKEEKIRLTDAQKEEVEKIVKKKLKGKDK